ncbi:hypothetical protein CAPTEDRAFT_217873 [Capitella teleta]|uniref:Uncharacterized protein n=1 Tax=Capitella teleta TaxID=283909 RepID=R7VFW5_CAPTE|nr:hypothetical protein CAPTEDRAFT_217873 [Capitella teleta]|eukprot:ELU17728.1 hypothetical protein CAPTEDRAFT_217873 [Capitella teleta]
MDRLKGVASGYVCQVIGFYNPFKDYDMVSFRSDNGIYEAGKWAYDDEQALMRQCFPIRNSADVHLKSEEMRPNKKPHPKRKFNDGIAVCIGRKTCWCERSGGFEQASRLHRNHPNIARQHTSLLQKLGYQCFCKKIKVPHPTRWPVHHPKQPQSIREAIANNSGPSVLHHLVRRQRREVHTRASKATSVISCKGRETIPALMIIVLASIVCIEIDVDRTFFTNIVSFILGLIVESPIGRLTFDRSRSTGGGGGDKRGQNL